ncbi:MAG: amidase, partial [Chloroflexi bacterium]|nr:amidase [Chloroflexota bacterium]
MSAGAALTGGTLAELSARIRRKDVSVAEVVEAYIERTDALEPALGAYITRMSDSALADAKAADAEIAAGAYRGPLHGVPVA